MKHFLALTAIIVLPSLALAQGSGQIGYLFRSILEFFANTIAFLGPVAISLALLAFFYSLIMFLFDKEKTAESKSFLGYSIIILFVMVSIWGIVGFLQENLGIRNGSDVINTPRVVVPGFGSGRGGDGSSGPL